MNPSRPNPVSFQSISWRPLLTGRSPDWRQSFLAEYSWESNFAATPTMVGVGTATAKLIKYPGRDEWTELFDLAADPYETKNLAGDPQHAALRARMRAEFDRQVAATGFRIPEYAHKPGDALRFPAGGHPDRCYTVLDLTGDAHDEIVVWTPPEMWIPAPRTV